MKTEQFKLFQKEIKLKKVITYNSLSICEKINYKSNECGLNVVFKSFYNYYTAPLFQPKVDHLTENYRWHHKMNAGNENRLNALKTNLLF